MPERSEARRDEFEREVRAALRTDPGTAALADATLVVEPGGVSNHAWRASLGGVRYFVRLSPPDSARLGVDRAGECRLLHVAAAAGLAPEVVRCDPDRRLLVTRHVQGRALGNGHLVLGYGWNDVGYANWSHTFAVLVTPRGKVIGKVRVSTRMSPTDMPQWSRRSRMSRSATRTFHSAVRAWPSSSMRRHTTPAP